jgi:hypothetical protein
MERFGKINVRAEAVSRTRMTQLSTAGIRAYARNLDDLSDAVAEIESAGVGVPVLLRQYLKLGGKLVGFNVDHHFGQALDGLIVVDLTRTRAQAAPALFREGRSRGLPCLRLR